MSAPDGGRSPFLPLLLLAVAVLGWTTFQTTQLVAERGRLTAGISGQDTQVEQSKKVRERLESLAARTARVARAGNANATLIVEELRRRGVTIDVDGSTGATAPPATSP